MSLVIFGAKTFALSISLLIFVLNFVNGGEMPNMDGFDFSSMQGMDFGGFGGPGGMGGASAPKGPTIPVGENEITDDFTDDQVKKLETNTESHEFQAEVNRLMDIIINSLYTGKEVFLRELISNAADALEKARFKSINDDTIMADNKNLDIKIEFDNEKKTISITDTGIGMNKQELINNLGTVAKSGTTNFLEALAQSGDLNLIGQFGVGFYSAFLVADKVTVASKSPTSDTQYIWQSSADASFSIIEDPRGNILGRGTRVTMHLKEDSTELLNENKLKELAQRYSQFIQFPIYVKTSRTVTEDAPDSDDSSDDVKIEDEEQKKEKIEKKIYEWEHVNAEKALWLRAKDDITIDEYNAFYKTLTRDWSPPMLYIHFQAEGEIEFKSILYIPKRAPGDMFENYYQKTSQVRLYVRRVLVADKFEGLIPKYLSFVSGVVDSDDFPLNVSREQLQQAQVINVVSKKLVRKILDTLRRMSSDYDRRDELKNLIDAAKDDEEKKLSQLNYDEAMKFQAFTKEFSKNMKLGCYEDDANRNKIAKLLRFSTSTLPSDDVSLEQYVSRMKPDQTKIYFASGESTDRILKSPQLQMALKKEYEVLLLTDPMSESCLLRMTEFDGKKFASLQKGDAGLSDDDDKSRNKLLEKYYQPLTDWLKKITTGITSVNISKRLVDAPCAIVTAEHGYSAYMEKMMKAQTFVNQDQMKMMFNSKILEINPNHVLINTLLEKVKQDPDSEQLKDYAMTLIDASVVASGFDIQDPGRLSKFLFDRISNDMNLDSENYMVDSDKLENDLKVVQQEEIARKEQKRLDKEKREKEKKRKQKEEKEAAESNDTADFTSIDDNTNDAAEDTNADDNTVDDNTADDNTATDTTTDDENRDEL